MVDPGEVENEAEHLWGLLKKALEERVPDGVWHVNFSQIACVDLEDNTLRLSVPNRFILRRLQTSYSDEIERARADAGLEGYAIAWLVVPPIDDARSIDVADEPAPASAATPARQPTDRESHVLEGYTFDGFVVGTTNSFAHAAALSVAETPGKSWNPLFIYGNSGLGKTHLLHAIRHYVEQHYPGHVVRYVVLETMLNEFIESIQRGTGNTADFRRRYRQCDVLLVDDIQFIAGKESLQEEFFHTFSYLRDAGKQIVLTSDRRPDEIPTLEERLRTRFHSGLLTDIQPPDIETRIAILGRKREATTVPLDVISFIAEHVTENIRELEGALIRVSAYAALNKTEPNLDIARKVLQDLVGSSDTQPITPKRILDATIEEFGFPLEDLTGRSRRQPLVEIRQIAMYVCREQTDLSYPAIGREFGGRDHTTVMHAVEKISDRMTDDRDVYDKVNSLTSRLKHA